jgi:hypothetical protein
MTDSWEDVAKYTHTYWWAKSSSALHLSPTPSSSPGVDPVIHFWANKPIPRLPFSLPISSIPCKINWWNCIRSTSLRAIWWIKTGLQIHMYHVNTNHFLSHSPSQAVKWHFPPLHFCGQRHSEPLRQGMGWSPSHKQFSITVNANVCICRPHCKIFCGW